MNKLYILEQKISTLELIIESLVEELIENELVNPDTLDARIVEKVKELAEKAKTEETINILNFPYWGEKGEA
jgi:hypothetical protein